MSIQEKRVRVRLETNPNLRVTARTAENIGVRAVGEENEVLIRQVGIPGPPGPPGPAGINIVGSIDCSVNPNYPATSAGNAYIITADGKVGGPDGKDVVVGDVIVATTDTAGGDESIVGGEWVVHSQYAEYATETTPGYIQIATQNEADAGTDDTKAVTPSKLATIISSIQGVGKFAADIGDAGNKVFVVNHGLASTDVHVQIKDMSTLELVETDISITDESNVALVFNKAPTIDEFRVIIQG